MELLDFSVVLYMVFRRRLVFGLSRPTEKILICKAEADLEVSAPCRSTGA